MAIPFPVPSSGVPILGQQIVVEGYTVTSATRCQCEPGGTAVLLTLVVSGLGMSAAPSACPRCGTGYAVQAIQMDVQGRLLFQIAVLAKTPPVSQ